MRTQEFVICSKRQEESSRLATLPSLLQLQIKRYLEQGDFRAAKALYDAGLQECG